MEAQEIRKKLVDVQHKGTAILKNVYSLKEISEMKALIDEYFCKHKENEAYVIRQLLKKVPDLKSIIFNSNLDKILTETNERFFISKAVFFDKLPFSNWYLTWHQDKTINVTEKIETDGFYGWTNKEGVTSVCPPEELLKKNLTIRIHLDDSNEENGGLKVIPGSHHKRLSDEEIKLITKNSPHVDCEVKSGGIHLMRPLLLHLSAKVTNNTHRKVIHLEFSSMPLPNGLEWAEKVII